MRWAFDPAIARNAHFNLDVLAARGRWFHPDFYGPSSDRMVVEWDLDPATASTAGIGHADPPPPRVDPHGRAWGVPQDADGGGVWLPLPARVDVLTVRDPGTAATVRSRLHEALPALFGAGMAAVSCRRVDDLTSVYRFEEGAA